MRRTVSMTVVSALALALITVTAADAGQPQKVFATRAHEFGQSAVNGAIAWAVDRPVDDYTYAAKVKLGTDPAFRVNPPDTTVEMGGLDLGNPLANVLLAYSRSRPIHERQWDIHLYDVEARSELPVPAGVNTDTKREGSPSVSGDYLLFERGSERCSARRSCSIRSAPPTRTHSQRRQTADGSRPDRSTVTTRPTTCARGRGDARSTATGSATSKSSVRRIRIEPRTTPR